VCMIGHSSVLGAAFGDVRSDLLRTPSPIVALFSAVGGKIEYVAGNTHVETGGFAMPDLGLTHVALTARDLDASITFYGKYAGMAVVHRSGPSGSARCRIGEERATCCCSASTVAPPEIS